MRNSEWLLRSLDLYYQATYTSSAICDALNDTFRLDLDKEYYQPKDLNKKIKKIS